MIKGQIWRNKRNGQLERINRVRWNEPAALTEHYLRARVSGPVNKTDLEKVSHSEALDYDQEQFVWTSLSQIKAMALVDNVLSPYVKTVIAPL